jgi:flotillin
LDLVSYEAYDKGRLPFVVDVKAFFRITDSNVAAQRVASFEELHSQLKAIVQGAVRTILASSEIEEIMQGRSKFGKEFTEEVDGQLANWGVATVKSIELMDIRDHKDSEVIQNIMAKKKSHIEMESRIEVAKNMKAAQEAEIQAKQEVDLKGQEAAQAVGLRTTQTERQVALAKQEALQQVKEQEKTTKEKEMQVLKVQQTRTAEIAKEVQIVQAQQKRETSVIDAEGQKQTLLLVAEGQLEAKRRESEGISLQGKAKADAEAAMQLAPIQAQIALAKEIGTNSSYQTYLTTLRQIEANQAVGVEQAKALAAANIKVIANTGSDVSSGLNSLTDLISSKGGTQIGSMIEGFANTDKGQEIIAKVLGSKDSSSGTVTLATTGTTQATPSNGKSNGTGKSLNGTR